ncbi:MAG: 23S rRNA (guanosine(2251)-2'-O)-methyltransferase RlmB [Pseudomonadota bacterium]|nr:23S rRNA (guanosine(2251)-2'-O)-methyltransferase RlmB [Pseudomonadota bacterium]
MSKSINIFGFHSIESIIKTNPELVLKVLIQNERKDKRINDLINTLAFQQISYSYTNRTNLDKISKGQVHQGVIAEVTLPPILNQESFIKSITSFNQNPLILILDSIQDPRNLGACLRSANAAGVSHVILNKDGSAPINSLVHRTSAGAINSLQIFHVTNLSRIIKEIQKRGIWVIGLDGNTQSSLYSANLTGSMAIVVGSEGKGIRQLIKKTCDEIVSIPMSGNIESLNVSVATAITLFEIKRQRECT